MCECVYACVCMCQRVYTCASVYVCVSCVWVCARVCVVVVESRMLIVRVYLEERNCELKTK